MLRRDRQRTDELGKRGVARVRFAERADLEQKMLESRALQLQHFATQQIERLDLRRAFVERRDACIARELLHAVLDDVAVAAENLQRVIRAFDRGLGEHAFHDRRQERDDRIRAFALGRVGGTLGDVFVRVRVAARARDSLRRTPSA